MISSAMSGSSGCRTAGDMAVADAVPASTSIAAGSAACDAPAGLNEVAAAKPATAAPLPARKRRRFSIGPTMLPTPRTASGSHPFTSRHRPSREHGDASTSAELPCSTQDGGVGIMSALEPSECSTASATAGVDFGHKDVAAAARTARPPDVVERAPASGAAVGGRGPADRRARSPSRASERGIVQR